MISSFDSRAALGLASIGSKVPIAEINDVATKGRSSAFAAIGVESNERPVYAR